MDAYAFETDEHRAVRETARNFAERHIAPRANHFDEDEAFDPQLYSEAGACGVLGIGYPEALGGAGGDLSHLIVAADEMILRGKSVGTVVGLGSHTIALPPILRSGTPAQQEAFVRPVVCGEKVAALAVTEPGGGSDVAQLTTTATLDGEHYVVNGRKTFITSGTRADVVLTAVRTGGPGHGGLSLLVIEKGTPGFGVSKALRKMGWWASDTAELSFDGCRVPAHNLIGAPNTGFLQILANFAQERLLLAAQCAAIASLALRESLAYTRERVAFGRPLTGFQVTRHKLADMATEVFALRQLVGALVPQAVAGSLAPHHAAMAKNHATDLLSRVVDAAVQLHGGAGYARDTVVERLYRDARLYPIGGGTREIMNEIIGKSLGL